MFTSSTPAIRFARAVNSVMEFKGTKLAVARPNDLYSKCVLTSIKLYTYEWTVSNCSMIKPVPEAISSPIFNVGSMMNMELQMFLTPSADDNMKIEIHLTSPKLTEGVDIKNELKKIIKNTLGLEFLDSNGKTVDYYMAMPYELKYLNTSSIYVWKKEENLSRFIHEDSLSIRLKLSMSFYSPPSDYDVLSNCTKSTKILMEDLKNLFADRSCFPDLVIEVGGQLLPVHKVILFSQCPGFAKITKSDMELSRGERGGSPLRITAEAIDVQKKTCDVLYIPNENANVCLSVLHFIYCGELYANDAVNDFAVYEFAKKYGVRELSMLLMPSEKISRSEIKLEKVSYTWYVKKFTSLRKTDFAPIRSPAFKTNGEVDIEWNLVLFYLDAQNIILSLEKVTALKIDVQTSFKLVVCNADGNPHDAREFKHFFTSSSVVNLHPGFMNSVSRFLISPDLLFNDTLTVRCHLVVSTGQLESELKHTFCAEYPDIDMMYKTDNFKKVFENEMFSDATLLVGEREFKVHKAFMCTRSPVFTRMFDSDMKEKHSGCVRIEDISYPVMKQLLEFIYTGKMDDICMSLAPELYRAADKYEILDLKDRCSEFIMEFMKADNACEILILSDLFCDEKLKKGATNIICRHAAEALLTPHGIELITNHSSLAGSILESLSAAYCSLPSQDILTRTGIVPPATVNSYSRFLAKTHVMSKSFANM